MNSVIEEIYQSGAVKDNKGNEYTLHSGVDRLEGDFLHRLIDSDDSIRKTLEIGCAYGLSSLHICSALKGREGAEHKIVDPFQHKQWHGIGTENLKRAECDFFELIEKPSELALPALVDSEAGTFDMVFIDGWHTFDHTLVDLFYANRLIKVGGYIVIDDCLWASVAKAVSYVERYPAYELHEQSASTQSYKRSIADFIRTVLPAQVAGYILPRYLYDKFYVRTLYSSMVALKKVKEDERNWDWYQSF
ncbi:class I SAM-dependent methyltransferase [uncultured Shewanella sp.]|uniref:class I SAM-dependent methyltransferase n=1 Tax=uncultured Shewanella sp. TaxID=173975 RepID=UPI00260E0303|nr:class I SAM-dependent methyltransferase [uncultured Shewanella sp.]